ncbi:MAG: Prevent-host-death family protein [uncultured Thiotrichaceae bacterium]|uniref:Prevent-host-death family protein n=1 Tax=uncultured Thiotrichaceae bacterium TaxID=298394 RepID=A0A6S6RY93_9GAMM|nr:MAG: Prevent-host-death family protein [uncultured Thiotrichaceae bacterium]
MQTFSIRDLREKSGELSRESEAGNPALITRRGKPLMVTLPFTQQLMENGIHIALAEQLYTEGHVSLARAAKIADMSYAQFAEHLSALNIPVVDYPPEELADELAVLAR